MSLMSWIVAGLSACCALLSGWFFFSSKSKNNTIKDLQEQVEDLAIKNINQTKEQTAAKEVTKLVMSTLTDQQKNNTLGQELHSLIKDNMTEADAIEVARKQVEIHEKKISDFH